MASNIKIGSIWLKRDKNNKQYLSGEIHDLHGRIPFVAFLNDKTNANAPDFSMFLSEPREEKPAPQSTGEVIQVGETIAEQVDRAAKDAEAEIDPKDLPF